jgi:hypothetical protein
LTESKLSTPKNNLMENHILLWTEIKWAKKVALAKKWHKQNRLQVYSSRLRFRQALQLVLSLATS